MKSFAVISDTHFGIKNFNQNILASQLKYFNDIFFKYIKENNIKTVFHLGDLVEDRVYVDYYTINSIQKNFLDFFENNGIKLFTILGNHDLYFKNSNDVSSSVLSKKYNNIEVITSKTLIETLGFKFNLVPYNEEVDPEIKADFLMMHTDTSISQDKVVNNYKHILSGHIHNTVSYNDGHIIFVGAPYQINWNNFNSKVGFYVYDEPEFRFIVNETSPKFIKLTLYDDYSTIKGLDEYSKINNSDLKELISKNYCKIYTSNKINENTFKQLQEDLISNVADDHFEFSQVILDEETININFEYSKITDVVSEYFEKTKNPNAQKLKNIFFEKYNKHLNYEEVCYGLKGVQN